MLNHIAQSMFSFKTNFVMIFSYLVIESIKSEVNHTPLLLTFTLTFLAPNLLM